MKPPSAETDMTEFGPAAAWIAALRLHPWLSGSRFLSGGTWHGVCWEKEQHPQNNCLCACKGERGHTQHPPIMGRGIITILASHPCKGLLTSYLSQQWGGGISEVPMNWTLLPLCLGKGAMCGRGAGSLCSAPIREEAFLCPGKPLVKDNQARCHQANSDGIKAVMKFTAGLASPSNGPAPQ